MTSFMQCIIYGMVTRAENWGWSWTGRGEATIDCEGGGVTSRGNTADVHCVGVRDLGDNIVDWEDTATAAVSNGVLVSSDVGAGSAGTSDSIGQGCGSCGI